MKFRPELLAEIKLHKPELKALYERIGSEEKLRAILRDFYRRMTSDVLVGFFFEGKDTEAIAERQMEFLLRAMGARSSYAGKAPAQAHESLPPILAGHFNRRLRILEQTLTDHGLSDEDIRVWMIFENAFRDGIVTENAKD